MLMLSPSPKACPAASAYCPRAQGGRNQLARELGQGTAPWGLLLWHLLSPGGWVLAISAASVLPSSALSWEASQWSLLPWS